jgi:hypothetical protein
MNDLSKKVVDFVSRETGIAADQLYPEFRIEKDAGIAGLDTLLFYEHFFDEFGIQPDQFNPKKYVTPEIISLSESFKKLISIKYRRDYRLRNITIQQLIHIATIKH